MRVEPAEIATAKSGNVTDTKRARLRETTQEFEAYFLQTMIREMRKTIPQDPKTSTSESKYYKEMLDEVFARSMSKTGRFHLAETLYRYLERAALAEADAETNKEAS